MLVRNAMTERVTGVTPETPVAEACTRMEEQGLEALPVLDPGTGRVVGVAGVAEVFRAVRERGSYSAVAQLPVREVMVGRAAAVTPDDPLEKAARLMKELGLPVLPVVDQGRLMGVLTRNGILQAFAEMLGVDTGTARITLVVGDRRGQLARIAEIIRDAGVNITHLGTFYSKTFQQYQIVIRVECENPQPLVELLEQHHYNVVHVE
ncbi:MAG: CBS domain-containing protein [Bacillota bacterium]|nr:MAG: hypothetical protein DIU70_12685 [Bacillota bacterium]